MTFGLQVLTLAKGATPVKVTGVRLVGAKGLTLIGARLADPARPVYQYVSLPGFPPHRYNKESVPALGATVTPGKRGWELLLGLRVSANGYPLMHGIEVEYRPAGRSGSEQQTFPVTFVVCTTKAQLVDGSCSPPEALQS